MQGWGKGEIQRKDSHQVVICRNERELAPFTETGKVGTQAGESAGFVQWAGLAFPGSCGRRHLGDQQVG